MTDPTPNTGIKGRRRKDGITEIHLGWRAWLDDYKTARHDPRRLVALDDRGDVRPLVVNPFRGADPRWRPAVFTNPERTVLVTMEPTLWARIVRMLQGRSLSRREYPCPRCGNPMDTTKETGDAWGFSCPTCHARHIGTKDEIGGVIGAGESEKV